MKNGNLYKLMATLMALIFLSAIGFAQTEKKVEKKELTYKIKVKEDGTNAVVDTIIIVQSGNDVDIDALLEEIEVEMEINEDQMKEIHVQVQAEMDELHNVMAFELLEVNEEVEKALETLQQEMENLDLDAEVRVRMEEALKTLEESELRNVAHVEKIIMAGHPVFVSEDGNVEVIVEGEGNTEAKVMWIEKDGKHGEHEVNVWIDEDGNVSKNGEHEVNVWVDDEGEKKVIIKKYRTDSDKDIVFYGDGHDASHNKMVMIKNVDGDMDFEMDMFIVNPASDKDFEKALAAGLPVAKEQRFEDIDLNINIDGDNEPIIGFKTGEEGKMKVTYYDENFVKGKTIKLKEKNGMYTFPLNKEELEESNAYFMLMEQNGKSDLMKLK